MRNVAPRCVGIFFCLVAAVLFPSAHVRAEGGRQGVIVRCGTSCASLIATIESVGGRVTFKYENVEAVAADVPSDRLADLAALAGKNAVWKDAVVQLPPPTPTVGEAPGKGVAAVGLEAAGAQILESQALSSLAAALPQDYLFNNALIGAAGLHAQNKLGQGVIVAVIDSGTANSPVVPALSGTVIGGENLVPGDPVASATSRRNDPHGTWVGTMIAAHAAFGFSNNSTLVRSLKLHGAGTFVGACPPPSTPAVACFVPMIGVAPASKIYALKVFASTGGGSPESRIIAAMDRAITLRRNFDSGMSTTPVSGTGAEDNPFRYNALNIQVVNMSLGGPTLFAGRDLEDQLTREMLEVGITIVTSAGNDGFAAMTGGSPGTGIGSLTVGAANTPVHERVLRDLQFGLGIGALYRPSSHHQTAFFSARGPTADGRLDPDVTANGFASFAQGTCGTSAACLAGTGLAGISLVSGTSFSSPTAAGAAALLRREVPLASATQVRNALIRSANPHVLGDGSGPIDQGSGFINVEAALTRLQTGSVSNRLARGEGGESVRENIAALGFRTVRLDGGRFSTRVSNLLPGQVTQFFVRSRKDTDRFVVTLKNITPELPAAQQNQLFGDDIFLHVVDAPTSFGEFRAEAFVASDRSFTIDQPQTGLVRVALQGDWTNAGRISADLEITEHRSPLGPETAEGTVRQGELIPIQIEVPSGTAELVFDLSWERDWGSYPTNDVDLLVVDPSGKVDVRGATAASPERVVFTNPAAGIWTALVEGFTIHSIGSDEDDDGDHEGDDKERESEKFELRVTADGQRLELESDDDGDD